MCACRIHSGADKAVLYNLSGRSQANILSLLKTALHQQFHTVCVEFPQDKIPSIRFIKKLISEGAHELHLTLSFLNLESKLSCGSGPYLSELQSCLSCLGADQIEHIRIKALVPGTKQGVKNIARLLAIAGARYIVIETTRGAFSLSSRDLRNDCAKLAAQHDVSIELRLADGCYTCQGQTWKLREAESMLLDIPSARIHGRTLPLGAVFQIGFNCNQNCVFCSADKSLPYVPENRIQHALDKVFRLCVPRVVFSGGEPTLYSGLSSCIAKCEQAGISEISIYTNGMAAASKQYAASLARAGLNLALVSLHSHVSATSDRITRSPGGFRKTTKGIENFLNESVLTIINHVINEINYRHTPAFVSFVKREFPGAFLNFSYVAPFQDAVARPGIVPRFRDAAPYLVKALDECDRLGVVASGLEPHWGIPPCIINADPRHFPFLAPLSRSFSEFTKADACSQCGLERSCYGVRRNYAELHGLGDLSPIRTSVMPLFGAKCYGRAK